MSDEQNTPTQEPAAEEMIPKAQYYRLAADFENYKKASEQQLLDMSKYGSQSVVLQMVDVMDHVDQAILHASDEVKAASQWWQGMEAIGKQFHETMAKFGVQRIQTVGKPFDPATMEAVSMTSGGESQTVQSEVRAGYTMHGRTIRPARVVIYQ
jgi:molecular chaperone GrpE